MLVAGIESSQVPPQVPATIPSLCHRAEDSTPLEPEAQLNPFFFELLVMVICHSSSKVIKPIPLPLGAEHLSTHHGCP